MCAGEIGVVCRGFALSAVIDAKFDDKLETRETIWLNGLYHKAKEGFALPSHSFSLQLKIPRRMSNAV